MSQKLKRVVVSASVAVVASATIAAFAWFSQARAQTPTPGTCAPISPTVATAVQFPSLGCRAGQMGPTTGTCTMYVLQGVPVLDCPGVALQKFSLAAWP